MIICYFVKRISIIRELIFNRFFQSFAFRSFLPARSDWFFKKTIFFSRLTWKCFLTVFRRGNDQDRRKHSGSPTGLPLGSTGPTETGFREEDSAAAVGSNPGRFIYFWGRLKSGKEHVPCFWQFTQMSLLHRFTLDNILGDPLGIESFLSKFLFGVIKVYRVIIKHLVFEVPSVPCPFSLTLNAFIKSYNINKFSFY